MKHFLTASLTLLIAILLCSQQLYAASDKDTAYERVTSTNTIRCGYAMSPPFLVKDPNTGEFSGFFYEHWEMLGRFLGVKIEWAEEVGWGNFIEGLNTGRYDVFCGAAWPDGPRVKNAALLNPIGYTPVRLYVRPEDKGKYTTYDDFNNPEIKFGGIDGDVSYNFPQYYFPKASMYSLTQMSTAPELFLSVTSKRADVVFSDQALMNDFLKQNPGTLVEVEALGIIQYFGAHYAVRVGETDLQNMLNQALGFISTSRSYHDLAAEYGVSVFLPTSIYKED